MFFGKTNKEQQRFYLLPGQGGEAYRRKQRFLLMWATITALLVSGLLGLAFYLMNRAQS